MRLTGPTDVIEAPVEIPAGPKVLTANPSRLHQLLGGTNVFMGDRWYVGDYANIHGPAAMARPSADSMTVCLHTEAAVTLYPTVRPSP